MPFALPAALLLATGLTSVGTGLNLVVPMFLLCAAWAAWDAQHIGARHFRGWLGRGSFGVFVLVSVGWVLAFPAYLLLRERIRFGTATPRPGLSNDDARRFAMATLR